MITDFESKMQLSFRSNMSEAMDYLKKKKDNIKKEQEKFAGQRNKFKDMKLNALKKIQEERERLKNEWFKLEDEKL